MTLTVVKHCNVTFFVSYSFKLQWIVSDGPEDSLNDENEELVERAVAYFQVEVVVILSECLDSSKKLYYCFTNRAISSPFLSVCCPDY